MKQAEQVTTSESESGRAGSGKKRRLSVWRERTTWNCGCWFEHDGQGNFQYESCEKLDDCNVSDNLGEIFFNEEDGLIQKIKDVLMDVG